MQTKTIGIIIVVILIVVGGYFLLRGSYQAPIPASTQTPTTETGQPTGASPTTQAPTAETTEISVNGTEFSFNPASISVKAGEHIKLTFKNNGRASHNLILEGVGVGTKTIGGGQTDVIEFTAPSSGTYNFFCSIPGHRTSGMEGSLNVE